MKKSARITITWNPELRDEAKISFNKEWDQLSGIAKADCLVDAISDLQERYNKVLKNGLT